MVRVAFWAAATTALSFAGQVLASCECGYYDPSTGATWTDASITYFNETGMDKVVTLPEKSPRIFGQEDAGDSGDGQQDWSLVGNHINPYEDSFGATWRTAISYNNTYLSPNKSLGLALEVSPANVNTRIVNSSQIVTRRRDIQYGTFRALIKSFPEYGAGSGFKWAIAYNQSSTVDMSIYAHDWGKGNNTLWYSYSASDVDSKPVKTNMTYLEADYLDFLEYRMDWLSHDLIQFRNAGANTSANFLAYQRDVNTSNIPTMPAPVSFQTWANGEPSMSQGPPTTGSLATYVLLTRFFFNSSLPERHQQFSDQCAAAAGNVSAICSTEDLRLRDSTIFTVASTARVLLPKPTFTPPLWAVIYETVFIGIFVLVMVHGYVIRRFNAAAKKKAAAEALAMDELKKQAEDDDDAATEVSVPFSDPFNPNMNRSTQSTDKLLLQMPELWDDDDDFGSDEEAELDEEDEAFGDIEGVRMHENGEKSFTLPSFDLHKQSLSGFASPSGFATPQAVLTPDDRAEHLRRWARNNGVGSGYFAPSLPPSPSLSTDNYSQKGRWSTRVRKPAIVRWRARNVGPGGDEVGRLAQPVAADQFDRRASVMFARQTLLQAFYNKARELIFIKGSTMKTSTGESRIDYLDGMRGFACLFVSLGHFILIFYYGIADSTGPKHYPGMEVWVRAVLGPIIINAGLVLGIFFVLPSRTMCMRYLLKGGIQSMADATVRRIPRLIIPVAGAVLANYFMIDVDAYKWVPRLASRTWSIWSYWQNFDNVLVFTNALLTLWWAQPPYSPALVTGYATGVLWTIPVIVQGMWTCMISALIAHEIKRPWKRFTFYFLCIAFAWYANSWDMFFMAGLIIADLDANLHYRKVAALGFPIIPRSLGVALGFSESFLKGFRIRISLLAWLFFAACAAQQYLWYWPNAPGADFDLREYAIHPDFANQKPHWWNGDVMYHYTNPRVSSWFFVMSVFILVDLSYAVQQFFRLRIWSFLGKHSMAYFLCHGVIFWTWGAWLCITMLTAGVSYWATVLVVFITSYIILTLMCICFTYTFEYWAILFSKAVWRHSSGNLGRKI